MRVSATVLALVMTANWAEAQSIEGLCDRSGMEIADEEQVRRLMATTGSHLIRCYDGYTPLHVAVSAGNQFAVEQLAEAGSDLDARNDFGSTALHVAILASNPRAVELLLELGANVHSFGPDAMSPLAFARHWGETEIARILGAHGARM